MGLDRGEHEQEGRSHGVNRGIGLGHGDRNPIYARVNWIMEREIIIDGQPGLIEGKWARDLLVAHLPDLCPEHKKAIFEALERPFQCVIVEKMSASGARQNIPQHKFPARFIELVSALRTSEI